MCTAVAYEGEKWSSTVEVLHFHLHGFESRRSSDFLGLLLSSCLNWKFTAIIILNFHLQPQFTYELFHIYFASRRELIKQREMVYLWWNSTCLDSRRNTVSTVYLANRNGNLRVNEEIKLLKSMPIKAPSTRIRIFSNPQLFLSGYGYRPHVSGEFDSESGKK